MLVGEADAEQARRRGRHEDVADQADQVREQDGVAEAEERVMAAEVDPQQREPDLREWPARDASKSHPWRLALGVPAS